MLASEKFENIARVCHEANRAYCKTLGDHSQPSWEEAPEWQRKSALAGVNLHYAYDHGPEASHVAWMNMKLEDGWKYGPVKDADKKEHPCMVPFNELPPEKQAKDHLFRAIVHALREF
jgi:RyR domain